MRPKSTLLLWLLVAFALTRPAAQQSFPRVLGRYVRELKVITLPKAVKKMMTSITADNLGISDRGRFKEGLAAGVTVLDQDRVIDRAMLL